MGRRKASVSLTTARLRARHRERTAAGSWRKARQTPARLARPGSSPKKTLTSAPAHVKKKCETNRGHSWTFFQAHRMKFFLSTAWICASVKRFPMVPRCSCHTTLRGS